MRAESEAQYLAILGEAIKRLLEPHDRLPNLPGTPPDWTAIRAVVLEAADRLGGELPYHHPLYIGQMLKPPHPVARLAHGLAMVLNPNNHALDGGRASSAMEREAVAGLAAMVGWTEHLGHLTSGGTMANFEALWVASLERPGQMIAASTQAHYTHQRLSAVLGLPFQPIEADTRGRMRLDDLQRVLASGRVGTVVLTLGTTSLGAVDPLEELVPTCRRAGVRVHVDAAYGGYFTLADNLSDEVRSAFDPLPEVDSVVIDPHKHGLQPYGCGCVLFRDPTMGRHYKHDSPYTYFSSDELHLGEISLECSRPGASAVALWATMRLLPLERGGAFALDLEACLNAGRELAGIVATQPELCLVLQPQLDIVVWACRAVTAGEASRRARLLFDAAARRDLHLALATLPRRIVEPSGAVLQWDRDEVLCLRCCAIKSDHLAAMPAIRERLRHALEEIGPHDMI